MKTINGYATIKNKIKIQRNNKYKLEFKNITILNTPIDFKERLLKSSKKPNNIKKWGTIVMGGCIKISDDDYKIFISKK